MLGLVVVVAAPNHYLQFIKDPPMPVAAVELHRALTASGYVFQMVVGLEIVAGVLPLAGIAVPLALILLAPIIVNIFFFHLFLAPGGVPLALTLAIVEITLAWQYRAAFEPLFRSLRLKSS